MEIHCKLNIDAQIPRWQNSTIAYSKSILKEAALSPILLIYIIALGALKYTTASLMTSKSIFRTDLFPDTDAHISSLLNMLAILKTPQLKHVQTSRLIPYIIHPSKEDSALCSPFSSLQWMVYHHLPSCPGQKPENLLNFGLLLFTSPGHHVLGILLSKYLLNLFLVFLLLSWIRS